MIKRSNPQAGGRRHCLHSVKKAVTIDPHFIGATDLRFVWATCLPHACRRRLPASLDTLLTHLSSDGVKLARRLSNLGSIVTLLDRIGEMGFAFIRLVAKEFRIHGRKMKIFSVLLIKKEILFASIW
jgi:hypothetical protein